MLFSVHWYLLGAPHKSFICISVVQLLITELSTVQIRTGDYANENTLYLVKAYLGILHNVARLCADSRKLFRSSNAVEILKVNLYIFITAVFRASSCYHGQLYQITRFLGISCRVYVLLNLFLSHVTERLECHLL